jgi:hypothetical protein
MNLAVRREQLAFIACLQAPATGVYALGSLSLDTFLFVVLFLGFTSSMITCFLASCPFLLAALLFLDLLLLARVEGPVKRTGTNSCGFDSLCSIGHNFCAGMPQTISHNPQNQTYG